VVIAIGDLQVVKPTPSGGGFPFEVARRWRERVVLNKSAVGLYKASDYGARYNGETKKIIGEHLIDAADFPKPEMTVGVAFGMVDIWRADEEEGLLFHFQGYRYKRRRTATFMTFG
jgi:hypothetical protein